MISAWIQYKGNSEAWWRSSALDICLQLLVALSYPVGEECSFQLCDVGKHHCGSLFNVKPVPLPPTNLLPSGLIPLHPNAHFCNLFHSGRELCVPPGFKTDYLHQLITWASFFLSISHLLWKTGKSCPSKNAKMTFKIMSIKVCATVRHTDVSVQVCEMSVFLVPPTGQA